MMKQRQLLDKLSQAYLEIVEQRKSTYKIAEIYSRYFKTRKGKLGNAIYEISNGEISVLCDGYYNKEVGVVDEPNMDFANVIEGGEIFEKI